MPMMTGLTLCHASIDRLSFQRLLDLFVTAFFLVAEEDQIAILIALFEEKIGAALRAIPGDRFIPCCKCTLWIIGTTPELFSSFRTLLHQVTSVLRASNAR